MSILTILNSIVPTVADRVLPFCTSHSLLSDRLGVSILIRVEHFSGAVFGMVIVDVLEVIFL